MVEDRSSEEEMSPPQKRLKEEKVRLNDLVVQKSIWMMKQSFSNEVSHESVNYQFASHLQLIHSHLKVSFSMNASFSLTLSNQRWSRDFIIRSIPKDKLKTVLREIFSRFKRFRKIIVTERDLYLANCEDCEDCEENAKFAAKILVHILQRQSCRPLEKAIQVKRLELADNQCVHNRFLIIHLSPVLKSLILKGGKCNALTLTNEMCEELFMSIWTCTNLQKFYIDFEDTLMIDLRFLAIQLLECLKLLKNIKYFKAIIEEYEMFDSIWLTEAFQNNRNLRELHINHRGIGCDILCADPLRGVLARLRSVSIDGHYLENYLPNEENSERKQIRQIMRTLPINSCPTVIVFITENEDELYLKLVEFLRFWIEIADKTVKSLNLYLTDGLDDEESFFDELNVALAILLSMKEEFVGLTVDPSDNHAILRFRNAIIKIVSRVEYNFFRVDPGSE